MSLFEQIKSKRPNIKSNTIQSYITYINKLYRLYDDTKETPTSYKWLENVDKIVELMKSYKHTTRKNFYNAIVVVLSATNGSGEIINTYSNKRDKEHAYYENLVKSHKKSDRQEKNWVELDEIDAILKQYKRKSIELYKKSNFNSKKDYPILQQYIILLTYRNIPMRNDVANMKVVSPSEYKKIPQETKEKHNYLVGSNRIPYHFQINEYKTKKAFGKKKIDIPKELNREIRKWLRVNTSGYFITNASQKEPISANGITKLLTKIFKEHTGKNVSTSMIRHIYLSSKYKGDLNEKEEDAHKMSHSLEQQKDYIKK